MLVITHRLWMAMVNHAMAVRPLEACGLLIAHPESSELLRFQSIRNEAASEREYRLDQLEYLRAVDAVEKSGLDVIGVMHSHPTTPAVPSERDIATATGPLVSDLWHWPIISLTGPVPLMRSYRRWGDRVAEERVVVVDSMSSIGC